MPTKENLSREEDTCGCAFVVELRCAELSGLKRSLPRWNFHVLSSKLFFCSFFFLEVSSSLLFLRDDFPYPPQMLSSIFNSFFSSLSSVMVVVALLLPFGGAIRFRQPPARKSDKGRGTTEQKTIHTGRRERAGLTIEQCGVRPDLLFCCRVVLSGN